jgi:hypothetical protein
MGKEKQPLEVTDAAIDEVAAEAVKDPRILSSYKKDGGRYITIAISTYSSIDLKATQIARLIELSNRRHGK